MYTINIRPKTLPLKSKLKDMKLGDIAIIGEEIVLRTKNSIISLTDPETIWSKESLVEIIILEPDTQILITVK